jgi:hypothetical protein
MVVDEKTGIGRLPFSKLPRVTVFCQSRIAAGDCGFAATFHCFLSHHAEAGGRQKQVLRYSAVVRGSMTPPEINSGNRRQAGRIVSRFCLRFAKECLSLPAHSPGGGRTNQRAFFGTLLCIEAADVFLSCRLRSAMQLLLPTQGRDNFCIASLKN